MRQKIFKNIIVVALFIIAVTCSSSKVVNTIDYKQFEDNNKPNSIQVVTEEGQEYQFSYSDYSIKDDTLFGGKKSGYLKK